MMSFVEKALLEAMDASAVVNANESVALKLGYSNILGTAARRVAQYNLSANGDLIFFVGSSTTSYTLDTLMSAAASGRIDVSDGSFNTIGEAVDYINSRTTATGWRAFPVDSLRSDSINNTLRTVTRTNAGLQLRGADLVFDTLTAGGFSAIGFTRSITGPRDFKEGVHGGRRSYADQKALLQGAEIRVDYSSDQMQLRLYERDTDNVETLRNTFNGPAGGATVTAQSWDWSNGGDYKSGLSFEKGSELIVRARASSAFGTVSAGYL